jgi:hypothetical protein
MFTATPFCQMARAAFMPLVEHDSAPFESGLSQCCTSDLNRRLENRRIATKNSTARSG